MADNLIFPIGFDLEAGIAKAQGDADKLLRKLEMQIKSRPLAVNLKIENASEGSINQITARMRELEKEWNKLTEAGRINNKQSGEYTKQAEKILKEYTRLMGATESYARNLRQLATAARQAANEQEKNAEKQRKIQAVLNAQENSITNITAKLKHWKSELSKADIGSVQFNKAAKEVQRLSEKLKEAEKRIKSISGAEEKINRVSNAFKRQDGYVSRLVKRLAVYASFSAIGTFIRSVRDVTAQFELQRVSLGAIIQDQQKANQLFAELKTFALQSPLSVLDLTKYTKQLAAYKIGANELFDTTKRLADISVGLGVSMDRIILMYGQIRATGYLRASEVRQATEAGIPLVEELAKKLAALNGKLVSAADVMDMISKRQISFEMVKEVFEDMTSAGGIFYNMQEKQGETLYGMWAKLGDAASIMYEEIGNTEIVNSAMKATIQTLRYLMTHWKQVGTIVAIVSSVMLRNIIVTKNLAVATAAASAANKAHVATLTHKLALLQTEQKALHGLAIAQRISLATSIAQTKAQIGAATATNIFSKALHGMKAALLSNPLTALAVVLTTIISLMIQAENELDKLNDKLQDIDRDFADSGKRTVDKFKELAQAAVESADGSKAQKEALDELNRTYGQILGSEALELKSLKALGGQYGELIDLIDAYNAKKKGEEKATAIKSSYGTILEQEKDDLKDYLNQAGMTAERQAEFIDTINKKILQGKNAINATRETFKEFEDDISNWSKLGNMINIFNIDKLADAWGVGFRSLGGLVGGEGMDYLYNYAKALESQNKALDENEKKTRVATASFGAYSTAIDNLNKSLTNLDWSSVSTLYETMQKYNEKHPDVQVSIPTTFDFDPSKANSEFEKMLEIGNMQIYAIFKTLEEIAEKEGVKIPETFYQQAKSVVEGNKAFSIIDFDNIIKLFNSPKAKAAIRESRALYEAISPNDKTVAAFRAKLAQITSDSGVELSKMTGYFMKAGDDIKDYAKRIKDAIADLEDELKEMQQTNELVAEGSHGPLRQFDESEIKNIQTQIAILKELFPFLKAFTKTTGGRSTADNRLQNLREIETTLTSINEKYNNLVKKEGETQALDYVVKNYASTLAYINKLGSKFGLKFEMPTDFKDLQEYRKNIQKVIETLKMQGYEKAAIELELKIAEGNQSELEKQLEEKLKRLADKVSRTKTAKEFYDKILAQTGNADLANRIAEGIYGTSGSDLFDAMVEQIQEAFQSGNADVTIGVDSAIDFKNQRINYAKLAEIYEQYQDVLIDKNKATAKKIVEEGQKTTASNILNWQKELAKAQDYEEQRTEILRKAHEQRQEIIKQVEDPEERARLIALSYGKQAKALADLSVKEFKAGEDFIKVFQNLDMVSNATLSRMKKRLEEMIDTVKDAESVEGLKTLIEHLEKIDEEQKSRDPFGTFIGSIRKYIDARKKMREAEANEAKVKAEYAKQEPFLDADITSALNEQELAQARVNELKAQGLAETDEGIKAQLDLEKATQNVVDAENAKVKAQKKVQKAEEKTTEAGDKAKEELTKLEKSGQQIADKFSAAASAISTIAEMFGIAEDSALGDIVNGLVSGLQNASTIMGVILTLAIAIQSACWWLIAVGAAVAAFTAIFTIITGSKVRKANKIIEQQKELVEQLEYSYDRLEKAIERAFGREYLSNYNQQLKNLYAQQLAYQRMAEAERSKGKKEDKEKTKEYLNNARDIANQIAEMRNDLAGKIVGEDLTSAARGFAEAWVEAKLSFSNTKDAILKEFDEMVKEMVMNQVMGAVAQTALKPFFDELNNLASDSYLSSQDIVDAVGMIPGITQSMIQGFEVAAEQLRKAGFDIMNLGEKGEYGGIAKNISNATSEEINNAAAIGNSLLFHVSGISRIDENVGAIRRMMELGAGVEVTNTASGADTTERQNKAMAHYAEIEANTAETVVQLRQLVTFMQRVMTTQNGVYGINTYVRK